MTLWWGKRRRKTKVGVIPTHSSLTRTRKVHYSTRPAWNWCECDSPSTPWGVCGSGGLGGSPESESPLPRVLEKSGGTAQTPVRTHHSRVGTHHPSRFPASSVGVSTECGVENEDLPSPVRGGAHYDIWEWGKQAVGGGTVGSDRGRWGRVSRDYSQIFPLGGISDMLFDARKQVFCLLRFDRQLDTPQHHQGAKNADPPPSARK